MQHHARYWEVDFARGIAVIMMIIYHAVFDLNYFGNAVHPLLILKSAFWLFFGKLIAILFLLIVGIGIHLKMLRISKKSDNDVILPYIIRGAKIFGLGLLVTFFTYVFIGPGFVIFGILHLIGLSLCISPLFIRLGKFLLPSAILIVLLGTFLLTMKISHPYLLWLGLRPYSFFSLDYYPLLPWFGVVLIGLWLGRKAYSVNGRNFSLAFVSKGGWQGSGLESRILWLGKHALLVYIIHQPVIIAVLMFFDLIPVGLLLRFIL